MSIPPAEQAYLISYGPDANCTLDICSVERSVYQYRPDLGASITFIALFFISMLWHIVQGIRYKTWFFMGAIIFGCVAEMIGYGGRIMLWQNPFSFTAFMMQIVCITFAPVFFAAAIYVSLTRITEHLDPKICRFPPKLYYWLFIPCDLVSLVLQAVGGSQSSSSSGESKVANDVTLAGLSLQVATLFIFIVLSLDYIVRYWRHRSRLPVAEQKPVTQRLKVFAIFFSLAIILILIRCCYRIDELSEGYSGALIHNEGLFIALEGVMVILAAFCLNIGHPGFAFQNREATVRHTGASEVKGKSGFESDSSGPAVV